jgi:type I restriction enzyme S subunit
MKLETFFNKFDQFADAPDAVAKMRELVLELSATGRLIPEALQRPVAEDTKLMGTIAELVMGQAPAGDECNTEGRGTVFVKVGEFGPLYPREEVWTTNPLKFAKKGDVLVCVVGATVGKLNLAIDCAIGRSVAAIRPSTALDTKFLYYSLIPYTLRLRRNSRGSAQGVIGKAELNAVSLWVPSRAEQKRIVAKMDELMALCDRLEAQQQERETRHAALARASLARFADAPTPPNLPFLFHPSYAIPPADLRKSILTLAVQGKLVPQDPNDEPALSLLEQIAAHKAALAKNGKLRGSTTVKPMADDEAEFDLPLNWCWVRFGEIMVNRDGERIPVSKEERETKAKTYDYYGASGVIDKIDGYLFDKPLLLIGEDGANLISRSTPIAYIARGQYWVNNHAHVLDGISEDFLQFIGLHINAINLEKYVTGSAQPKMNQAKMNSIPIALPPLSEQRRIVAKVDQLMALVDALETQLAASRVKGQKLLEAVVGELTLAS